MQTNGDIYLHFILKIMMGGQGKYEESSRSQWDTGMIDSKDTNE